MKLYANDLKLLIKNIWLFLFIITAPLFLNYGAAVGSMESESLGLIIKSIEMVEEKPLLAAIFNIKTGRTIEYTVGDYVEGRLIRDILEDRVVLYDEITRHQFVLIYNDVVSVEENEDRDISVIRIKEKKRDFEEMNVTNIFNNELNKARGAEPTAYGTPDSASEDEKKLEMQNYTRNFQDSPDGFDKAGGGDTKEIGQTPAPAGANKPAATVEVEIKEKPAAAKSATAANTAAPPPASQPADTKAVEVNQAQPAPSATPAATAPKAPAKPEVKPPAGGVVKTPDGTTVKIREKAKKQAESAILDE
jgi:hypothetical protein